MSAKDKVAKAVEALVLGTDERKRQQLEAEIRKAQEEADKPPQR